ncbi:hypothetical protein H4Q26_001925 [Puccinia striiformis f. sp. tritici PST-130]|nr:hypothetical protein H4Q26_001925 [Puccinia striiformis f. sp. tritici PST-130]
MVGGWLDHQLAPPFVQRWANNGTWPPTLEASEIAHLNVVPILMFWAKRHPTNPHVTQTFAGEMGNVGPTVVQRWEKPSEEPNTQQT